MRRRSEIDKSKRTGAKHQSAGKCRLASFMASPKAPEHLASCPGEGWNSSQCWFLGVDLRDVHILRFQTFFKHVHNALANITKFRVLVSFSEESWIEDTAPRGYYSP